jgi:predicted O-methyltransferase YrrM
MKEHAEEHPDPGKHEGYRNRIELVCDYAVQCYEGDIVEIGVKRGKTTERLLKVAEKHGRKVIAVDPFKGNASQSGDEQAFYNTTKPWRDILTVIKKPSQTHNVKIDLMKKTMAFAFVDGDHSYEGAFVDIHTVKHAGIIAVDDILWISEVYKAFWQAGTMLDRKMVAGIRYGVNEGYLV